MQIYFLIILKIFGKSFNLNLENKFLWGCRLWEIMKILGFAII